MKLDHKGNRKQEYHEHEVNQMPPKAVPSLRLDCMDFRLIFANSHVTHNQHYLILSCQSNE